MANDDIIPGPKQPTWDCKGCGKERNWACRVRCVCGKAAPREVAAAARRNAGKQGRPFARDPATSKNASSKIAGLEAEIARLRKAGAANAKPPGEPDAADPVVGKEALLEKIKRLEARMAEHKRDHGEDSIHKAMDLQLGDLRKQMREAKPVELQQRAWSGRVEALKRQFRKAEADLQAKQEEEAKLKVEIAAAQLSIEELQAELKTARGELKKTIAADNEEGDAESLLTMLPAWMRLDNDFAQLKGVAEKMCQRQSQRRQEAAQAAEREAREKLAVETAPIPMPPLPGAGANDGAAAGPGEMEIDEDELEDIFEQLAGPKDGGETANNDEEARQARKKKLVDFIAIQSAKRRKGL